MTDGLKDAHREAIVAALAANDRVERAVLFGSRATGTNTVTSDVDIALYGGRLTLTDQARLAAAVNEIPMAQSVDLILYDSVCDRTLREHIQNDGVEWFTREHLAVTEAVGKADIRRTALGNSRALSDWRESSWGDEISLEYGKARRGHANSTGPFRVFGSNGPIGWTDTPLAPGPGVVLGRKGAYRGVAYSPDPFFVIDTAYYVASKSRHDMRWLFYAIKHYKLGEIDDGSPIPSTTRAAVYPCKLAVPPLPEQRAIAHVLGTLDDRIELNRRMNETLEAMTRALFKSWFVDFDPVRAKMKGRDTGLPRDIAALFPDRLVDSEMGEIPEGWEVKSLKDCMNLTMGQSPPGSTYNDHGDGLPFFQGRSEFGFRYPEKRRFCSAPTRVADPDDTLVSVRAPVGDINLAWERCCIGRGVAALRHKSGSSSFTYHSAWALQRELKEYEHTGTVFGAINKGQFQALKVTEPDPRVVEAFDAMAVNLDARIRSNTAATRTWAGLRDTILPTLISGEIRVPAAERLVESVS